MEERPVEAVMEAVMEAVIVSNCLQQWNVYTIVCKPSSCLA